MAMASLNVDKPQAAGFVRPSLLSDADSPGHTKRGRENVGPLSVTQSRTKSHKVSPDQS